MTTHSFNFEGGEELSKIGATWFVSYAYWHYDTSHTNWTKVKTCPSRISTYNKTKQYHIFWLKQVLDMNPNQLIRNEIKVDPETTKEHARELLSQCMKQEEASSLGQKEKDIIKFNNNNKTIIRSLGDEWHKNCKYRKVDENILDRDWWKTDNADYYAKAYERIPIWANKPHQLNSMIVWSFFKAEEIDGFATINLMKGLCIDRGMSEHQFKINYASMKLDSSKSHGKVFEDDGENVWIWEEIKPRLMQYKNAFYKGE